jgi:hypothetical protein
VTHPPEVDLQLIAGLTIGDPHRRALPAPAAAHLADVTLHRPQRHHRSPTRQQLVDPHSGQPDLDPPSDDVVVGRQLLPRRAVTIAAMRTHHLDHRRDELIAQLIDTAIAGQAELLSGAHVAADRLAVHLRPSLYRAQPLTIQPQPEHFSDLVHADLPEHHDRPS